jgi:hypothetical protein
VSPGLPLLNNLIFTVWGCQTHAQPPTWRTTVSFFVWLLPLDMSPWWRRRQVPPKRRFLQEPHGVTTQKTPFFISF